MSEVLEKLADAVINGKIKEAKPLAEDALEEGIDAKTIIFEGLSAGMEVVGDKYENKEYFLPQVLLSAQAMYAALDIVLPELSVEDAAASGRVVIGVVEGDVHDIGKNIVKAMLTGAGLTIFDLGRDIPLKDYIAKVKEEDAHMLATSTLMTPTLAGMEELEKMLKEENLKGPVKSMIGGGATSREFADKIGADGWAYDATEAVKVATKLLAE